VVIPVSLRTVIPQGSHRLIPVSFCLFSTLPRCFLSMRCSVYPIVIVPFLFTELPHLMLGSVPWSRAAHFAYFFGFEPWRNLSFSADTQSLPLCSFSPDRVSAFVALDDNSCVLPASLARSSSEPAGWLGRADFSRYFFFAPCLHGVSCPVLATEWIQWILCIIGIRTGRLFQS